MNNLLILLQKWARKQDENFLTEILVFLLNHYAQNEPQSAIQLIKWITQDMLALPEKDLSVLIIEAQHHTAEGSPDIRIETPNFICFIEVKVDSDFGSGQLATYKKLLDAYKGKKSALITLTRYKYELHKADKAPDIDFRWHQLSDWLDKLMPSFKKDGISEFITKQYIQLLKNRGVAMEQINWQLVEGLRAFRNIVAMLEEAIGADKITRKASTWEYRGYYVCDKFLVGMFYDKPHEIIFSTYYAQLIDDRPEDLKLGEYVEIANQKNWRNYLDLTSEEIHFFSLSKTRQLTCLEKFVTDSLIFGKLL